MCNIHSPSNIIPADYIYCFSYSGGGFMEPAIGLNAIWKLRDEGKVFADKERGIFQCNSCGARFRHGDCWLHVPTGHYVFFGHICSDKYGLLADRSFWEMEVKDMKARKAKEIENSIIKERQETILSDYPDLLEAFDNQLHFIQKIKRKFERDGYISQKQIEAVLDAHEKSKEENRIPAKVGKQTVNGIVLKAVVEGTYYGPQVKMTVKVEDEDGTYFIYGTMPASLNREFTRLAESEHRAIRDYKSSDLAYCRGYRISFSANFKRSPKDESFAFFSRPTKARIVSKEKVAL